LKENHVGTSKRKKKEGTLEPVCIFFNQNSSKSIFPRAVHENCCLKIAVVALDEQNHEKIMKHFFDVQVAWQHNYRILKSNVMRSTTV
jgi:hypothetical protein